MPLREDFKLLVGDQVMVHDPLDILCVILKLHQRRLVHRTLFLM